MRELENAVEHTLVLCRDDLIRVEDLPEHLIPLGNHASMPAGLTLHDIEKMAILPSPATQKKQKGRIFNINYLSYDLI